MENKTREITLREALAEIKQQQLYIPRAKQAHGYKYAPLEMILPVLLPVLHDYGIDFQHITDYNEHRELVLTTTVFFIDGRDEEIICKTIINPLANLRGMNEMMVIGAGTTYFRRYHLVTIFGLTTEPDTDAGGAEEEVGKDGKKEGNVSGTNFKASSVDGAQKETDFTETFKHQLSLVGKTEEAINKTFNMYKSKMGAKQIKTITNMIKKHYEKK